MKNYSVISKIALVICFCFILLAMANGFTGFINSSISLSGTLICIIGFGIAIFAITILEKERQKKKADKGEIIMMSKKYWINWAKAAGIRAAKTFAEALLGFVGVTGVAIGEIDWVMALGVAAAATVASVLMSIVGLPEVTVENDGDLVIDGETEDEDTPDA